MHKLVGGDGYRYLTRQVAAGDTRLGAADPLVAYYEATGTPPGRWLGSGVWAFGARRDRLRPGSIVSEAAMVAVFRDGHDPLTLTPLGRAYNSESVRGYDLTFSAFKSAAVLWALAPADDRTRVEDAHHAAVAQALEVVARSVVRTRTGAAGRRQVTTRGMVAAAFDHFDTRAGDPGLHTHVVLANKVQGPDGRWRSLDGKTIHAATVAISELYDGLLADELHRRLGVTCSHRPRGAGRNDAFEVDGIDDSLIREFSTRADRIHKAELAWAADFTERRGRGPSRVETIKARQHLTRETRPAKTIRPLSELLTEWANRARALTGLEPVDLAARALGGDYGRGLHAHDVGPVTREALVAQTLDDAAEHRSVWTTWNLRAAAARTTIPLRMHDPEQRTRLIDQIVKTAQAQCVHLDAGREPITRRAGEALFTSAELLAAERTLVEAAERPIQRRPPLILDHVLQHTDALNALAPDQRDAVETIVWSRQGLDVLVGPAGTGKTTTLAALAQVWSGAGGKVIGLAPSASAAHTLQAALGVPCHTTAKWLYETIGDGAARRTIAFATGATTEQRIRTTVAADPTASFNEAEFDHAVRGWQTAVIDQEAWRLHAGHLVVVDEASLADTRTLAELVTQAQAADARVLLVGDHLQRGAVAAGGAFGMLARRSPTAELTSLWRFTQPWEAHASLALRHAQPEALDTYQQHGAISAGPREDMLDTALTRYADATDAGRVVLLQAADTRTVRDLNAAAHSHAILAGRASASGGVLLHDGLTATVGDRWFALPACACSTSRRGPLRVARRADPFASCTCADTTASTPGTWSTGRPHGSSAALDGHDLSALHERASSPRPIERRSAITAPLYFVKFGDDDEVDRSFEIAHTLAGDPEAVVHKAVGIFVKHAGRRLPEEQRAFLECHAATMPRPGLRLAIAQLDPSIRRRYLQPSHHPKRPAATGAEEQRAAERLSRCCAARRRSR